MQYSFSYFQNSIRKFIILQLLNYVQFFSGKKKKQFLKVYPRNSTSASNKRLVWDFREMVCVCIEVVKSVRLQSSHVHTRVWTSKFTETGEDTKPQSGTCEVYFSFDFILYRGNKNLVKMFIAIEWGEFSRIE